MENYFGRHDQEEAEDTLSFCNSPINDVASECDFKFSQENSNSSSDQDLFEFFTNSKDSEINPQKKIIFCGKLMIPNEQRDHTTSKSFNTSYDANRASSPRLPGSKPLPASVTASFRHSSTLAAKSRKQAFMIGMGKVQPTMELSDMRERQNRRTPASLIPAINAGEMVVSGKRKDSWGLLRLLKCRSHFGSALAKSSLRFMPLV